MPRKMNPADNGTRGLPATPLCTDDVWWSGPKFLAEPAEKWPVKTAEWDAASLHDLPGLLKAKPIFGFFTSRFQDHLLDVYNYGTWQCLTCVPAWCQRFVSNCRHAISDQLFTKGNKRPALGTNDASTSSASATVSVQVRILDCYWISRAQTETYQDSYRRCTRRISNQPVLLSDPLASLAPEVDRSTEPHLMVVGKSLLSGVQHHIIVLPSKHWVTWLTVGSPLSTCCWGTTLAWY